MTGAGLPDDLPLDSIPTLTAAPPRRPRRSVKVVAWLAALALVGVVALGAIVYTHVYGSPGATVEVTLPATVSRTQAADVLTHDGVVSNAWLFRLYLHLKGAGPFHGGVYDLRRHEGYAAALRALDRGPRIELTRLTVPEGFTLGQIAERVGRLPGKSATRFLEVAQSGVVRSPLEPAGSNNLEGLLFPDTYFVRADESEQAILQQMVDQSASVASEIGLDQPGTQPNGLTAYQTVVVASIIEREAKVPEDRGMIARVILNRLQKGMKLQIDATVLYALGGHQTSVTNADLQVNSPYNTYRVAGLPPAPISNPGRASLAAALNPTPGTWLYYVLADASGKHAFATTESEFLRLRAQAKAKGLLG
jgi:peptidoglycan lytic transglycosylase G